MEYKELIFSLESELILCLLVPLEIVLEIEILLQVNSIQLKLRI